MVGRSTSGGSLSSALGPARAPARFSTNDAHAIVRSGRAPASRVEVEVAGSASYRLLLSTYANLVNKVGSVSAERIALSKLSSWITESRLTGLALIERDRIALANARFDKLGKISPRTGRWIACGDDRSLGHGISFAALTDVVLALAGRMLRGTLPSMVNVRYKRERAGHVVNVRLERGPPRSAEAAIVLALVDDATHEAKAEDELVRTRQALLRRETLGAIGEIASGVAHDLANLLAAMQMRTVIMQREPGMNEAQRERLEGLTRILDDGAGMLTRLQDFARAGMERRPEPLNLASVIRESVDMVHSSVTEKAALAGVCVKIALKLGDVAPVMGIAVELRQMFINLLLNARDAMPRGGTIEITTRTIRNAVIATVEDEGTGVPPEIRGRIFEPFFTTKGGKGTGLGLAMAYELMKKMGGNISVANRRPGGAVFRLRFPTASSPAV